MFTEEQITDAHSKVQSGADFPAYIRDLKKLGIVRYETYVEDGHTCYYGAGSYKVTTHAKYGILAIAEQPDAGEFRSDLTAHQQGKTTYATFCDDAARSGIEKWIVDTKEMTCAYYDANTEEVLIEQIPQ